MDPQPLSPIATARTAVATAISSWKEKADFNCAAYTAAHRAFRRFLEKFGREPLIPAQER